MLGVETTTAQADPPAEPGVDEALFRATMTGLAKCVAVTTALGPDGPVGCTTTSLMSLSVAPPSVLLAFGRGGRTLDDLLAAGRFAVNVLSHTQGPLVRRFATGTPAQRFRATPHAVLRGVPVLHDAAVVMTCDVAETLTAVDHVLVVGTVRHLSTTPGSPLVLVTGEPHIATPVPPAPAGADNLR
ncbi:flavin reductase family protein [Streptomyces dubilierae]|uniref:Flavin reductase family protein n=1 Tax=Streptomyces dubilierae TaxID=3075533 RepID=A0ABU2PFB5_9ACTN|nr:flavin reductase family protein [Streptomyces sp. DSM 41921]MDT0390846.1 flavin reductase family protein [Streptomyces sp. DSM 41921]